MIANERILFIFQACLVIVEIYLNFGFVTEIPDEVIYFNLNEKRKGETCLKKEKL